MSASRFDINSFTRFHSAIAFSGVPITSAKPTTGQNLAYDSALNQFVYRTGAQGPAGTTGAQGPPGQPGMQGDQGQMGDPGPIGTAGADGAQGAPGLPGSPGDQGPMGAQGPQGASSTLVGPIGPPGTCGPWDVYNDPTTTDTHLAYNVTWPTARTDNLLCGPQTTEGASTRLMFFNTSGAFRAGTVSGTQWNVANRGVNSWACGLNNRASADQSACIGGDSNTASGINSVVGGGMSNIASGLRSCVVGGGVNAVPGVGNTASGTDSFVGGGELNNTNSTNSGIGGGGGNVIQNQIIASTEAVIISGNRNVVNNCNRSIVGSGTTNIIRNTVTPQTDSGICAGSTNTISSTRAFIGSGTNHTISGNLSAIPCGQSNTVSGANSFAMGQNATVTGAQTCQLRSELGTTTSADGSFSFVTGEHNLVSGGSRSHSSGYQVILTGNGTFAHSCEDLALNASLNNAFYLASTGGVIVYSNAGHSTGVSVGNNQSSWVSICDRNAKKNIVRVDDESVLREVMKRVNIYRYNFIGNAVDDVCVGPMAQEWHEAFPNTGKDALKIDTMDLDGVAIACVSALHARLQKLRADMDLARSTYDRVLRLADGKRYCANKILVVTQ